MKNPDAEHQLTGSMLAQIEADLLEVTRILFDSESPGMYQMIAHHFGWQDADQRGGGKRLRPLLVLLCCMAAGGNWSSAIPAATSVELIHNFSLIHDDIQDRSSTRRGRPTVWSLWGEAQAINTGDAVFALARYTTGRLIDTDVPVDRVLRVQQLLDETCLDLTRGQYLDLKYETDPEIKEEDYLAMIQGKTASLLSACTACGGILAGVDRDTVDRYQSFGMNLGMAFQIVDDQLGIWGVAETTGKSTTDDLQSCKKTLPVIYGLQHSEAFRRLWSSTSGDPQDIPAMRNELESSGALEHTRAKALEYSQAAEASLRQARPGTLAATILAGFSQDLLDRTK